MTQFSPFSFKDFQLNSHLSTLANIHKIYHTLNKLVSQFFKDKTTSCSVVLSVFDKNLDYGY